MHVGWLSCILLVGRLLACGWVGQAYLSYAQDPSAAAAAAAAVAAALCHSACARLSPAVHKSSAILSGIFPCCDPRTPPCRACAADHGLTRLCHMQQTHQDPVGSDIQINGAEQQPHATLPPTPRLASACRTSCTRTCAASAAWWPSGHTTWPSAGGPSPMRRCHLPRSALCH